MDFDNRDSTVFKDFSTMDNYLQYAMNSVTKMFILSKYSLFISRFSPKAYHILIALETNVSTFKEILVCNSFNKSFL